MSKNIFKKKKLSQIKNNFLSVMIKIVEWILDILLDNIIPYHALARIPLQKLKVSKIFYFDYIFNQKFQRIQLLQKMHQAGVKRPVSFKAWWPRGHSNNFGDVLTHYVLSGVAGFDCIYTKEKPFLAIGSIIRLGTENSVAWGSGIIRSNERIITPPKCLAVRGPLTREAVISAEAECPEVYGDPAMLIPLFYQPKIHRKKTEVLIAPHFKHSFLLSKNQDCLDIRVGNIQEIETCIDNICSAKVVLTSSLHVFIMCVAYSIPVSVFKINDVSIHGDNIKFEDFCLGIGIENIKLHPVSVLSEKEINNLLQYQKIYKSNWSPVPLLEALNDLTTTPLLQSHINTSRMLEKSERV